jgi:hypothetical protein
VLSRIIQGAATRRSIRTELNAPACGGSLGLFAPDWYSAGSARMRGRSDYRQARCPQVPLHQ